MGMGDWIMATAQVARLHAAAQRPVIVVDRWGRVQWSVIFEGNPKIVRARERARERGSVRLRSRVTSTRSSPPGARRRSLLERSRVPQDGNLVGIDRALLPVYGLTLPLVE